MRPPSAPRAIGFDYGRTLVQFSPSGPDLGAAEPMLAQRLETAGFRRPFGSELAPMLDSRIEELIADGHRRSAPREIDIQVVYRDALEQITGQRLPDPLVEEVCAIHQRCWVAAVVPIPEAVPVLRHLRSRGILVGLCSNAPYPPWLMREQLAELELVDHFDAIVFSSEVGWRKPSAEPFQELLRQLGTTAGDTWFIGDEVEADMGGAAAVGMTALLEPATSAPDYHGGRLGSWAELLNL